MTNSTGSAAHVAGLMPGDASNTLANEDLLPTTAAQRHWTWKDFAALWVGMVVCVPTYTMASSMLDQGFTWQMAVWLVFLANCIVLVPMVLIGRVGPRYGVPFPVLARASFGVKGANLPAVLRGLVACGWFSINCYFGALALHGFLNILGMGLAGPADGQTISTSQFMCFLAFWAVHIWFIWKGPESIRMLEVIAAPLMIIASIALVVVFFFLRDSRQLGAAVRKLLPFEKERREQLISLTRDLVYASTTTMLAVAAAQGVAGGIAFAVLGINAPVFWGVVMGICALVPVFGTALVWLPAASWLILSGSWIRGLILIAIGVGIVGMLDNLLRPALMSGRSSMNGLLIFISLLGGVTAFGFIGLVLGPVVAALVLSLLQVGTAKDEPTP